MWMALLWAAVSLAGEAPDGRHVRGVTISCQTWGQEWASPGFDRELERLQALGVNWVAIHPYASIRADGSLAWRKLDPAAPPLWLTHPIEAAHARGMSLFVIPHVAYWGSPWSWRGAIEFTSDEQRARFFADWTRFLSEVAAICRAADGFSIGNELDRLIQHEAQWRALIAAVRSQTRAHLTYASNWSDYERVPFWDALDAIGVQAYFPLTAVEQPTREQLLQAWQAPLQRLAQFSKRWGKPVVFTELGYPAALSAAREPWAFAEQPDNPLALAVQERCLETALEAIEPHREWLRGAFLWKWFVGDARRANFRLQQAQLQAVIARAFGRAR